MEDILSKELAGFLNAMVEFSLSKVSSLQLEHLYRGPSPDVKGVFGTYQGCCLFVHLQYEAVFSIRLSGTVLKAVASYSV